jgi:hypothetical protein
MGFVRLVRVWFVGQVCGLKCECSCDYVCVCVCITHRYIILSLSEWWVLCRVNVWVLYGLCACGLWGKCVGFIV